VLKRVFMDGSYPSTARSKPRLPRDQVLQRQAFALVAARDVYHQPQVGADKVIAGLTVAVFNAVGEVFFLVGFKSGVSLISRR